MPAKILYKITWNRPGEPEHTALAVYETAAVIRTALLATGVAMAISVYPAGGTAARHAVPEPPVDEPLMGAAAKRVGDRLRAAAAREGELDAYDRAAMSRLGAKAFPHHEGGQS